MHGSSGYHWARKRFCSVHVKQLQRMDPRNMKETNVVKVKDIFTGGEGGLHRGGGSASRGGSASSRVCIQESLQQGGVCIKGVLHQGGCIQGVCIWVPGACTQGDLHPVGVRVSASRVGWVDPPPLHTMGYGKRVGGTHPTGMHSSSSKYSIWIVTIPHLRVTLTPHPHSRILLSLRSCVRSSHHNDSQTVDITCYVYHTLSMTTLRLKCPLRKKYGLYSVQTKNKFLRISLATVYLEKTYWH